MTLKSGSLIRSEVYYCVLIVALVALSVVLPVYGYKAFQRKKLNTLNSKLFSSECSDNIDLEEQVKLRIAFLDKVSSFSPSFVTDWILSSSNSHANKSTFQWVVAVNVIDEGFSETLIVPLDLNAEYSKLRTKRKKHMNLFKKNTELAHCSIAVLNTVLLEDEKFIDETNSKVNYRNVRVHGAQFLLRQNPVHLLVNNPNIVTKLSGYLESAEGDAYFIESLEELLESLREVSTRKMGPK